MVASRAQSVATSRCSALVKSVTPWRSSQFTVLGCEVAANKLQDFASGINEVGLDLFSPRIHKPGLSAEIPRWFVANVYGWNLRDKYVREHLAQPFSRVWHVVIKYGGYSNKAKFRQGA